VSAAVEVLGVGDLEDLARDETSVEGVSVLGRPAPLVVRDPVEPVDLALVVPFLRRVPTVTVLWASSTDRVAGLADAFDVCVTSSPDPVAPWSTGDPDAVAATVAAQPLAALALAAHLRTIDGLDVWSGLAAESAVYGMLLGGEAFRDWRRGRPHGVRPPDAGPPVVVDRTGDRLALTLNRPAVHNAFDAGMRDALVEALQLAAVDESVTAVSLRGAGPSFCSGGDLDEFGSVGDGPVAHAVRLTRHPGWWMHACRDRVTAHLHGACVGAGIELPAFADHVEATPDAVIWLPEVAMGLIPGAGGTVSLTRRIGRQRTAWLALTGAKIDAATATRWGLVDRLVDERPSG
jgi:enoyl-CoA hydratase/carnithine racemase